MCVCTAVDLGNGPTISPLHLLRDLVRVLERHLARQLEVQRRLGAPVELQHASGCGSRARPAPPSPPRARARARPPRRRAARRGRRRRSPAGRARPPPRPGRPPCAPGRRPPPGNRDDDVDERAPRRLAQAQSPHLNGRLDAPDRCAGRPHRIRGRPVHQHVDVAAHQPGGRNEDERGDEERGDRVARRDSRPRPRSGRASTATVPARSLPKWNAFASSASLE